MRKDKVKIGMPVCHNKTSDFLGFVMDTRDNVVIFDGGPRGKGIAGYTDIDKHYGELPEQA